VFSLCVLVFAVSAATVVSAEDSGSGGLVDTEAAENGNNENNGNNANNKDSEDLENAAGLSVGSGIGLLAAALATGLSGVGGGIAVASSAAAAIGAISENPRVFGQALIFVALAEGVALYGLIISLQILAKL
jgi:F0F1-type ATP synthase membrane subunit c/vacuolar-type H+-ATPase subunit K